MGTRPQAARILFYETNRPYGCFSNFSRHRVVISGLDWPTSEHFFQASKLVDAADREAVRAAASPMLAAQIGRDRRRPILRDWEARREAVMSEALAAKFRQHPVLREILLSTGDCEFVEHTTNDAYWGDGGDGRGANRLGALLMIQRSLLQPQSHPFLVPPWIQFPDNEVSDLHWRMGAGEDYGNRWVEWHARLSQAAKSEYEAYFPPPPGWVHSA
jgi:ribA/ribD-fused uncharacterized protein